MRSSTRRVRDLAVFAMIAAIIIVSQISLQTILGIQLNGFIIAAVTVTYRWRALIPIYVYILLYYICFPTLWSLPYFYIWLPLWGSFMLGGKLSEFLPLKFRMPLFMLLCGLYGVSFGLLYAPFQAIVTGWKIETMLAWYKIGLITADIPSGVNNFAMGILILPMSELMKKLDRARL